MEQSMNRYIGQMLDDRYEILEVIGSGGMSVVYKAMCHKLHRYVAVKILRDEMAEDAELKNRFQAEAHAVAMLSQPNIVSVYDVGHSGDTEYIVMELIDGITLKQYMQKKEGRLNWRESLYFITQIVRALGHAHSRGIIHRDIKPQNIMVLRDGSVKVADFGIARIMSAAQNTLTQEALGSVHYISPEHARGSHIDARADIYSAGVVLYEMLTGRLPFDGDSPVSVAIQHISAKPMSPRELIPDIPLGLEEITMKAMASRIDQRYMNAEAMLRDLEIDPAARLRTLSKGSREKVQLVLVMSRDARLYVLDEPIGGVDPAARDYILRTILSNYREGATVLLSTHLIYEIENILDRVLFLRQGQIVLNAGVDEIRTQQGKSVDTLFREVFRC